MLSTTPENFRNTWRVSAGANYRYSDNWTLRGGVAFDQSPVNDTDRAFVYLGLAGEPALGPATFMHRFSGMDNPEAPITHHWLDSTHITFGVATVGYSWRDKVKLEGSIFTGREPDQSRWDIETPKMDSQSVRLTVNPADDWSFQVSYGHLNSPEQLEPGVDQQRITASATYNVPFGMSHENN